MITIGGFTLNDDTDSPVVNVTEEYFRTSSGIIVGGKLVATITGTVSIDDTDNASLRTGSLVMKRLAEIRNLGQNTACVFVNIPNFNPCGDKAKVTNVTINQGPDPSWVNQGEYTIEVTGAVQQIPTNPFGIVASDGVTEFSRDETMEIGEDCHGYVFDSSVGASKAFVKFINSITLKTENLCCGSTNAMTLFNRLVRTGPTLPIFVDNFRDWRPFLHSRSMTIENDGRINFKAEIIYTPPGTNAGAFVDLDFGHSRSYQSDDTTYTTSGTVTGLVSLNWSNLIVLPDTCSSSKLANAMGVYLAVASKYSRFNMWGGQTLELQRQPNCPREDTDNAGDFVNCRSTNNEEDDEDGDDPNVIKPSSSTVAISRTEGVINFTFEWSTVQKQNSGGDCFEDGIKKETTVEIINPQPSIIEHVLPGRGTMLQNLACETAKKVNITVTETYPEEKGSCDKKNSACRANDGIAIAVNAYVPPNSFLISHTITETNNSYSIKQSFIECR